MSEPQEPSEFREELPRAKVNCRKWNFSVVWVVPLVAAILATYLVYGRVQEFGPRITIKFKNGNGIRVGQTPIKYRGVQIGEVTAVELSKDQQDVLVKARLVRSAAPIARQGAVFWIVRPEVGLFNVAALGTVITGPEIEVLPGTGDNQSEFVGVENAPVALDGKGLKVVLVTGRAGSLRPGSPVYYRGVEVGIIQDIRLSTNAATVEIQLFIKQRYARLVRNGSKFWNVSGMDVNVGLFRGLEVNMESLRSMVLGGIALATPNDPKDTAVKNGTVFPLYEKPEKEWLDWAPPIKIPPS
jgi:paraquat-inducible protein B